MQILGTLRNIITVVVGVFIYAEVVPLKEAAGYTVALVGFIMYNLAKMGNLDSIQLLNVSPAVLLQRCMRCESVFTIAPPLEAAAQPVKPIESSDLEQSMPLMESNAKAGSGER